MVERRFSVVVVLGLSCICCQAERSEAHAGAETVTTISTADAPSAEAGSTPPPATSGGAEGGSAESASGTLDSGGTLGVVVPATPGPLRPDPDDPTEILFAYAESAGADEVMVDEQWVYWSNGNSLVRGLKTGKGTASSLGPTGMWHATMQLAQDAEHVYWVRDDQLVQVNKRTAATQTFSYGDFNPFGGALTVSDGRAYLVDAGCLHLAIVQLSSSELTVVEVSDSSVQGAGSNVVVVGDSAYCSTGSSGRVYRYDVRSGEVFQIALVEDSREVVALAVGGAHAYWLSAPRVLSGAFAEQRMFRADRFTGADADQLGTNTGNVTARLLFADDTLYWMAGGVNRFDLTSGTHRLLTDYSANRADLALDEEYVYWLWPGYVYRASVQALEAMPEGVIPRGRPTLTE